jgi:hypothetical protein
MTGLLLFGAVVAGCNDASLSGLGHMTERWIAAAPDPTTTTASPVAPAPVGLQTTHSEQIVAWVNDELGDPPVASPEDTVAMVWSRSNKQDGYVQASRAEIAVALPGLEFPELIPERSAFITSQLVFDSTTGKLASDPAAAFGFWSAKPYTKARSIAQLAVLIVAIDAAPGEPVVVDTIGVPEDLHEDIGCEELAGSTVEDCWKVNLADGCPAWSLDVTDGWRLVWSAGGYRYDLFVRHAGQADLLARMAGSCDEMAMIPAPVGADRLEGTPAADEPDAPLETAGS